MKKYFLYQYINPCFLFIYVLMLLYGPVYESADHMLAFAIT